MQAWTVFVAHQIKQLGNDAGKKWLASLKIVDFDACNLYLEASDPFQVTWFEEHMRAQVQRELKNPSGRSIKVHLQLATTRATTKRRKKSSAPLQFTGDKLAPHAKLENFIAVPANQIPFQLLKELADEAQNLSSFNPIYLYGPSGSGKTHLLMSMAHAWRQQGRKVFYVHAETFTEHVVQAMRHGGMQEFRQAYRNLDLLLLDDVHLLARRAATEEELFHTFNALHLAKKQMIFAAPSPPLSLKDVEARLVSRFEWGITLSIQRLGAEEMKAFFLQRTKLLHLSLSQEIAAYLLQEFSHITTLSKALHILSVRPRWEDLQLVEKHLAPLIERERQMAITPRKVLDAVATFYGIRSEDILGKAQTQECSVPRQIAMYLCREVLKMPYLKIGEMFSRDHSTVMASVKQVGKKLASQEKEANSAVACLRQILM